MDRALLDRARACFLQACWLDVAVRKPGNVSIHSAGHRMLAEQFVASARAFGGAEEVVEVRVVVPVAETPTQRFVFEIEMPILILERGVRQVGKRHAQLVELQRIFEHGVIADSHAATIAFDNRVGCAKAHLIARHVMALLGDQAFEIDVRR